VNVSSGTVTLSIVAKGPRTVLTLPDGIGEHWDLPSVEAEPLRGGYHNDVLRLDDVVIRIEQRELASVAWEHELLAWLKPAVPEVVAPLPARDGSTFLVLGERVASALPYVDGTPHGGLAAAELLARIHCRGVEWPRARERPGRPAYADLDWERNDWWDWSLVQKPPELVRAFDRARGWVAEAPPLVYGPIHGDLAVQNVLSRDGRIRAVLDWEYARLDWPALELANAAWTLSHRDVDGFVRAYHDAGGPGEPAVLQEGILIRVLANALYLLTAKAHGRAYNAQLVDYLLATLREIA
jgi:Ser/Thr protein kinase RdoA (MazF antagonist)